MKPTKKSICILMGSKSDEEKMKPAVSFLQKIGVSYDVHIASAHRTPKLIQNIVNNPDYEVFIAGAGMAAALPGCIAALTIRPVIGVPLSSKYGLEDSLLSIIQMPPGIPVNTVGIDAAKNAAIAACQILALNDPKLAKKLQEDREEAAAKVYADDTEINNRLSTP